MPNPSSVRFSRSAFSTPRRLTLVVGGLPVKGQDIREEKKGPRVGSPDAAVQGFLKSAGLTDLSQAKIESDPKKGEFYVAVIEKKGGATLDVLMEQETLGRENSRIIGEATVPPYPTFPPTMLVHGAKDVVVPPENSQRMAARLPAARPTLAGGGPSS